MTALTYAEAQERSRLLDVRGYRVELDLTGGDELFGSATVIRCRDLLGRHPAGADDEMRLVAVRGLIDSASGADDVSALPGEDAKQAAWAASSRTCAVRSRCARQSRPARAGGPRCA